MSGFLTVLSALVGWVIGGLVNVLADDLPPASETSGVGRVRAPHCPHCEAARPIGRYSALIRLVVGRRCPACGRADGWRPVVVEVVFAAAFAGLAIWAEADIARLALGAVVFTVYGLISVIDIEHRLILWRTVWVSAVVLLGVAVLRPSMGWEKALIGGAVGFGLVFLMFLVGQGYAAWVARRRGQPLDEVAFGGGDVNLAALVGLTAGWPGVIFALLIGVGVGGIFAIGLVVVQLLRGRYDPHQPIAYGPFLAIGALALYFFAPAIRVWLGAA